MADRQPVWKTETLGKMLGNVQAKKLENTFVLKLRKTEAKTDGHLIKDATRKPSR